MIEQSEPTAKLLVTDTSPLITLAAARSAIAQAEASVAYSRGSADARARLLSAQDELARARQVDDPVAALDAARRALRHAEDAKALAEYSRLGGR